MAVGVMYNSQTFDAADNNTYMVDPLSRSRSALYSYQHGLARNGDLTAIASVLWSRPTRDLHRCRLFQASTFRFAPSLSLCITQTMLAIQHTALLSSSRAKRPMACALMSRKSEGGMY